MLCPRPAHPSHLPIGLAFASIKLHPAGCAFDAGIATTWLNDESALTKECKKRLVPAKVTGVRLMIIAAIHNQGLYPG
jgi:hypothetical protein